MEKNNTSEIISYFLIALVVVFFVALIHDVYIAMKEHKNFKVASKDGTEVICPELYKIRAIIDNHIETKAYDLQEAVKQRDDIKIAEIDGGRQALLELHAVVEREINYVKNLN